MLTPDVIPGLTAAASADAQWEVCRTGRNEWWVVFGTPRAVVGDDLTVCRLPSDALARVAERVRTKGDRSGTPLTLARLEHDACGVWVTIANADDARPLVVRRAGWVDVRGHPGSALGVAARYEPADDRVGLGPGDSIVFQCASMRGLADRITSPADDRLLDSLVDAGGRAPAELVAAIRSAAVNPDACPAVAIGVPHDLGPDPRTRVAAAIGVPADELELPGYPLGDAQPELWHVPPRPPRLARLRLTRDATSPRAVRQLLDRLLASWRLDGRVDDHAADLAASELATNAFMHAGSPRTATIRYLGRVLRVEVEDASTAAPFLRTPGDAGGRGLRIVDDLASSWGVDPRPDGKRVWFELDIAT